VSIAVLVNPAARAGAHTHAATRAVDRLRARGHTATLVSGGSAEESTHLLGELAARADVDAIAVAGGDGTVRLALSAAMDTGTPLGIIPCGTGNDFATMIGLRERDPVAAADVIADGITRRIDLARVTDAGGADAAASTTLYGTVLASGFDSRVNDRANAMRWPRGGSRYTIAILREFVSLRDLAYVVDLTLADGSTQRIDGDLIMASVGNGRTYGGGIPICPDADPADGLLDVALVRPAGRVHLLRMLPRLYRGTHTTIPEVSLHRVRSVHLHSDGVTAYADGDPIGSLPITIDVVPQAISVFTPR